MEIFCKFVYDVKQNETIYVYQFSMDTVKNHSTQEYQAHMKSRDVV